MIHSTVVNVACMRCNNFEQNINVELFVSVSLKRVHSQKPPRRCHTIVHLCLVKIRERFCFTVVAIACFEQSSIGSRMVNGAAL